MFKKRMTPETVAKGRRMAENNLGSYDSTMSDTHDAAVYNARAYAEGLTDTEAHGVYLKVRRTRIQVRAVAVGGLAVAVAGGIALNDNRHAITKQNRQDTIAAIEADVQTAYANPNNIHHDNAGAVEIAIPVANGDAIHLVEWFTTAQTGSTLPGPSSISRIGAQILHNGEITSTIVLTKEPDGRWESDYKKTPDADSATDMSTNLDSARFDDTMAALQTLAETPAGGDAVDPNLYIRS